MKKSYATGAENGWTLVELLVVISIIMILVSVSSVYFIQITKQGGMTDGMQMFRSSYKLARSKATSSGFPHFLVFHNESDRTATAVVVKDTNRNGKLNFDTSSMSGDDELVESYDMPKFVNFRLGTKKAPPLFKSSGPGGEYWIKFASDGTIAGASKDPTDNQVAFKKNNTWRDTGAAPTGPTSCDLIMAHTRTNEIVYVDWEPAGGNVKDYFDRE